MRVSSIAVFGSSEPNEGDPLYQQAREVGRALAAAGFRVVTGGYGGVMEAASRGAVEGGGAALGVVCSTFAGRRPNRFLTEIKETDHLLDRTRALLELAAGFVVLPGKSGTLAELATVWALHRAGGSSRRPVILLGGGFRDLLRHLVRAGMLETETFEVTRVVDRPEEVLDVLSALLPEAAEG